MKNFPIVIHCISASNAIGHKHWYDFKIHESIYPDLFNTEKINANLHMMERNESDFHRRKYTNVEGLMF